MVQVIIDGKPIEAAEGGTVLKAAETAGITIPHFCYHPAFAPEGSCRMCQVEIEGSPKLELACSTVIREGMIVRTQSERVREARRQVLEFLLADHPLDCPICDKAGECRLQDYFREFGFFESRFREPKERRGKLVRIGEKLILDRERCVLCTRCVRFLKQVAKTGELGIFNRGNRSEVGVFENILVGGHYSGNVVDLCPVGAITNEDFRFATRTWFLNPAESVCSVCSRGCNIWIDVHPGFPRTPRKRRVYRVRPRQNDDVNGFWMCDIGRSAWRQWDERRQERVEMKRSSRDLEMSWDKALVILSEKIKSLKERGKLSRMAVILNSGLANEELVLCRALFRDHLGLDRLYFVDPVSEPPAGLLYTGERTANVHGAKDLGFRILSPGSGALSEGTDLLLIFGSDPADMAGKDTLENDVSRINMKVRIAAHASVFDSLMDLILPAALPAEKAGSFTNVDGKIQRFGRILDPAGDSRSEGWILAGLARGLGITDDIFKLEAADDKIHDAVKSGFPIFRERP